MQPLKGLLVIALEQAVAGPMASQRLADAGARVIKIERMGGETARHYDAAVKGTSAYFAALNRGKESAELNIKEPIDRNVLERMIAGADVFIRNIAPGAAARLGLDAKELLKKYPHLIVVDIFGYDQNSTYAKRLAYDMLIQAESGVCAVTGTLDNPVKVGVSVADLNTGIAAYSAILEALLERGISGKGKAIEIRMFDVMAELMSVPLLHFDYAGKIAKRVGLAHSAIAPYGKFSCKDGDIILVCQQHVEWLRFCEGVLQMPYLPQDERFVSNTDRAANQKDLSDIINAVCATLTRAEIIARLDVCKLPWANVSTLPDLSVHPALRRIDISLEGAQTATLPASPVRDDIKSPLVPAIGEHTEALRKEFAP